MKIIFLRLDYNSHFDWFYVFISYFLHAIYSFDLCQCIALKNDINLCWINCMFVNLSPRHFRMSSLQVKDIHKMFQLDIAFNIVKVEVLDLWSKTCHSSCIDRLPLKMRSVWYEINIYYSKGRMTSSPHELLISSVRDSLIGSGTLRDSPVGPAFFFLCFTAGGVWALSLFIRLSCFLHY